MRQVFIYTHQLKMHHVSLLKGGKQMMQIPGGQIVFDMAQAAAKVNGFFKKLNIPARVLAGGSWLISGIGTTKGGSNIDIMVRITPAAGGTLAIEAYTNLLPNPQTQGFSTENMLALCRDLLEFNGLDNSGDAYFSIRELTIGQNKLPPSITVEIRRPLRGLDHEEFIRCVNHVAIAADENDERLTREFNAPKMRMQFR